jgi:hypothetical protein
LQPAEVAIAIAGWYGMVKEGLPRS